MKSQDTANIGISSPPNSPSHNSHPVIPLIIESPGKSQDTANIGISSPLNSPNHKSHPAIPLITESPVISQSNCRLRILLPHGHYTVIQIESNICIADLLTHICAKRSLDPTLHALFIQFNPSEHNGTDPPLLRANPSTRIDHFSDYKYFVVMEMPAVKDTLNVDSGSGAFSENKYYALQRRRHSIFDSPISKETSVRLVSEEFPRVKINADDAPAQSEKVNPGLAIGTENGDATISKRKVETLRAITTFLWNKQASGLNSSSTSEFPHSPSSDSVNQSGPISTGPTSTGFLSSIRGTQRNRSPSSASSTAKLSPWYKALTQRSPSAHNSPIESVQDTDPDVDGNTHTHGNHPTIHIRDTRTHMSHEHEYVERKYNSDDIRNLAKRALIEASHYVPISNSDNFDIHRPVAEEIKTTNGRNLNSKTLRCPIIPLQPYSQPTDSQDGLIGHSDALAIIKDTVSGSVRSLLPESDLLSVTVTLPNMTNYYCNVSCDVTMQQLLSYVCKKHQLLLKQFTFEIVASKDIIELDRTVNHYFNKDKLTSFNLVNRAKSYNSISLSEGDTEMLILQCQEGRLRIMGIRKEKLLEIITLNTDLYDLLNLPKPEAEYIQRTYSKSSKVDVSKVDVSGVQQYHEYDYDLLNTFLTTYRLFMSPQELLECLIDHFNSDPPENPTPLEQQFYESHRLPLQIRCVQAIGIWVDQFWNDFALNSDLKNEMVTFMADLGKFPHIQELAAAIHDIYEYKTREYEHILSEHKFATQKSKTMSSMLMNYSAELVAQQICIYNWRLFQNIHPVEYLNHICIKRTPGEESQSPSLDHFIARFDLECYWVATEICTVKDQKKRASVISQFIEIAQHCLNMNNFFSTFSLVSGLGMRPVERMQKTWKLIDSEEQTRWNELVKVCDPSRNMKQYRDRLALATPPIVPFLPIYLKDLTFLNDGNPLYHRGLINMDKLRMMAKSVNEIVLSRGTPYDKLQVAEVQNYLKKPPVERDVAKLKELSLELEPNK